MLLYNITIGSTVMFRKDKEEMEEAWKSNGYVFDRAKHKNRQLTVVNIYSTFGWKKTMFKPKGWLRLGATVQAEGAIGFQHVGIKAIKPIMVSEY